MFSYNLMMSVAFIILQYKLQSSANSIICEVASVGVMLMLTFSTGGTDLFCSSGHCVRCTYQMRRERLCHGLLGRKVWLTMVLYLSAL